MWTDRASGLFWAFGVPACLVAYLVTQNNLFTSVSYAATVVLGGIALLRAVHMGARTGDSSVLGAYFLLWFVLLMTTFSAQFRIPQLDQSNQIKVLAAEFLSTSVIFLLPYFAMKKSSVSFLMRAMEISGILISLSVIGSLFGISIGESQSYSAGGVRAFGPLGDQVAFALPLYAMWAAARKSWTLFAFHLAAIMATSTRGAILVLGLGLIALAWLRAGGRFTPRGVLTVFSTIVIGGGAFAALLASPIGSMLMTRSTDDSAVAASAAQRLGSLLLGVDIWRDHLLTGVGYNGYNHMAASYNPHAYFLVVKENYITNAGNQWIQVGCDGGILAVVALALFLLLSLRCLRRAAVITNGATQCYVQGAFAWLAGMMFGDHTACWFITNNLPGFYVFMMAGLGCAVLAQHRHGDRGYVAAPLAVVPA